MSVDVTNMTFKVSRATEVWQSMSSNTLLFQLEEGKMVKAMDAKAVALGSKYYVPIVPRGWVSASDLEGFPWPGDTLESAGSQDFSKFPSEAEKEMPRDEEWKESDWSTWGESWKNGWDQWQWNDQQAPTAEGESLQQASQDWWAQGGEQAPAQQPANEEQTSQDWWAQGGEQAAPSRQPVNEGQTSQDCWAQGGEQAAPSQQPANEEHTSQDLWAQGGEQAASSQQSVNEEQPSQDWWAQGGEQAASQQPVNEEQPSQDWWAQGAEQAASQQPVHEEQPSQDWWAQGGEQAAPCQQPELKEEQAPTVQVSVEDEEEWEHDGWFPAIPQHDEKVKEEGQEEPAKTEDQAEAPGDEPHPQEVALLHEELLQEGMPFRALGDVEVRQAANPQSNFLCTLRAGNIVTLSGKVLRVDHRGLALARVPIKPRGWVNADALQPLSERGAPGLVAEAGNLPKAPDVSGGGFENFEAVFEEPSYAQSDKGKGAGSKKSGKNGKKGRAKENQEKEQKWPEEQWSKDSKGYGAAWHDNEDPLMSNDPWGKANGNGNSTDDPLFNADPWAQAAGSRRPKKSEDNWSQAWSNGNGRAQQSRAEEKSWAQDAHNGARDPIYENDPWAQEQRKPLQPWQPSKEPPAKQEDFLEAALGPLELAQEKQEWDQFKANEELFGVQSSYNEAHYTTPLDPNKVSRHVVMQAEEIAQELESKASGRHLGNGARETRDSLKAEDVEILSSEDEEARFSAVRGVPAAPRSHWPSESRRRYGNYGKGSPAVHLQDFQSGPLLDAYISQKYTMETQEEEYQKVCQVLQRTQAVVTRAGFEGEVVTFGSSATGFKSSGSDVDVAYTGHVKDRSPAGQVKELSQLVRHLKEEFQDVTPVFGSKIPVVKFHDPVTDLEVDFCIKNDLGIRNSQLLDAYCRCDPRVPVLGKLVKEWTKTHELVGVPDGCLNSYAYMIMMIHYLQSLYPPVVVNLQELATEPHMVKDAKWGVDVQWDTKFLNEVEMLQPSDNRMSNAELLFGFFTFFGRQFDWSQYAVCIRCNGSGRSINKFSLQHKFSDPEQWYIEDPFDLRHNLASGCSAAGRRRILKAMHVATSNLLSAKLKEVCGPSDERRSYFLKCKVDSTVTAEVMEGIFQQCDLVRIHLPVLQGPQCGQAFLEFDSAAGRRKGHSRNGGYVGTIQLQLMQSSKFALEEAMEDFTFRITDLKFSRVFQ